MEALSAVETSVDLYTATPEDKESPNMNSIWQKADPLLLAVFLISS
jgi:hypothetical protein